MLRRRLGSAKDAARYTQAGTLWLSGGKEFVGSPFDGGHDEVLLVKEDAFITNDTSARLEEPTD